MSTGDWRCACGQAYRCHDDGKTIRLWPRSGNAGYSRVGLVTGARCIRCGVALTPAGATR